MSGEMNLQQLLAAMQPELVDGEFVFCSVSPEQLTQLGLVPLCLFQEREGITLILSKEQAERARLDYTYVSRMVTLSVHSSLEAVGFLAVITAALAAHGISTNTISAYYHDHLFVPTDKANLALRVLHELSQNA